MGEFELDVIFAGQTGSGKSSLINMIVGVRDRSEGAAEVSNDSHPCTLNSASYSTVLGTGLRCKLWDTRGLDEGVAVQSLFNKLMENLKLRQRPQQQLKEALKERTKGATPILIWCIEARNVGVGYQWQLFQKVYTEYCQTKAKPAIAITHLQGPQNVADWEERCSEQLRRVNLDNIPLRLVRKYQNPLPPKPGPEYGPDGKVLRELISQLSEQINH